MNWQFFAEADTSSLASRPWYPREVYISKRLVDSDGSVLTSVRTSLEDVLATCDDLPSLAAEYLSAVRSHYDIQYDLIYTGRDEPHASVAIAFGHSLAGCLSMYRAILNENSGEI